MASVEAKNRDTLNLDDPFLADINREAFYFCWRNEFYHIVRARETAYFYELFGSQRRQLRFEAHKSVKLELFWKPVVGFIL